MTTIICAKDKNKVVMAADSRCTAGHNITTDNFNKIVKIDDKIFYGYSGSVCTGDIYKRYITDIVRTKNYDLLSCKNELIDLFFEDKLKELLDKNKDIEFLICNNEVILQIQAHCVIEIESFYSVGSGSKYATGAFDILYNNEYTDLETIAINAIKVASKYDVYTNDNIKTESLDRTYIDT